MLSGVLINMSRAPTFGNRMSNGCLVRPLEHKMVASVNHDRAQLPHCYMLWCPGKHTAETRLTVLPKHHATARASNADNTCIV